MRNKIEAILYPTDLSVTSCEAFSEVVKMAKQLRARITLFYQSEFMRDNPGAAFGPAEAYEKIADRITQEKRTLLSGLVKQAESEGVTAKQIFMDETSDLPKNIFNIAQHTTSGLIAMVSKKEGLDIDFLGSTTRSVIRNSVLPVWVIHRK